MRLASHVLIALAVSTGAVSLTMFAAFLLGWSPPAIATGGHPLVRDAALSIAFFLQHSGMVRLRFRARLGAVVPPRYLGAIYAVASGLVLGALVLLWQRSDSLVFALEGAWRWAARAGSLAAIVVFFLSVRALHSFDPFGLAGIRAYLHGRADGPKTHFVVAGPYRWVRHPLYSCMLVLAWSCPVVTTDRLLFDLMWTAWIWLGAKLEERDLVEEFGDAYRRYRDEVPMLVPSGRRAALELRGRR